MSFLHASLADRMRSTQSSAVRELLKHSKTPGIISLAGGIPAPDLFDLPGLRHVLEREINENCGDTFQYGLSEGEPALREQIAVFLPQRGIRTTAERILITSGSQQALDIIAKAFLNPGDVILVERPSYLAALQVFALAEARVVSAPGDAWGIDVDRVEEILAGERVKAVYLVPNFGNPSGAALSGERRRRLVELAARRGVLLIEDDPYGELRMDGEPLPSLYEIARSVPGADNAVIYLSTFSKILSPGLRTGWMVIPEEVYGYLAVAKQAADLHSCTLSQRVAARYLAEGRLAPRLPVLREAYRQRRDALLDALRERLGGAMDFNTPDGGMFLWARFAPGVDAAQVLKHAIEEGVVFVPGASFFAEQPERNSLRLSYSTVTAETAGQAASRLAAALDRTLQDRARSRRGHRAD